MVASAKHQSSIMFTDMVGYSRMVSKNQDHALKLLDEHNNIIIPLIKEYEGTVIKLIGDSVFAHFDTSHQTAHCAVKIQENIQKRNKLTHMEDQFNIRIGLHKGQFVVKDNDLFGHDVNLGSRIEGIAPKDGIAVSELFFRDIASSQNMWLREMGHIKLKNIVTPQKIYKLYLDKEAYQKESDSELLENQDEQGVTFVDIETYKESQIHSLGVLYLDNLGKDEDEILCYSISDNLITDLRKVSSIRSPSFITVQKFKNSDLPLTEIARRLNVDNIITGSMLKSGDKIKVSMEMMSTLSGDISWSDSWEGNTRYTGTLNGQILSTILEKLKLDIPEHIKRYFTYEMTENADANESYIKGKQIVDFLHDKSKLLIAEDHLKNAITFDEQFIEAYAYLAMVYRWMNQFQKAERQLESALKLAEESFNEPGLATVYNYFGILYRAWKNYPKAITCFEKGLELYVQLKDQFGEGKILQNMGGCYSNMLKIDLAQKYMQKALEIYQELEEEHAIGNTQAELGNSYKNRGEFTQALQSHLRALGIFRKLGMKFMEYRVLIVIAGTYENLGMYEVTDKYIEELKLLSKDFNDYNSLGRIYSLSSEINYWKGDLNDAEEDMQEAIDNFDAAEQDTQVIFMRSTLAYLYFEMGKKEKAEKMLRKSERIAEKTENTFQILRIQLIKELIRLDDGDGDENVLNDIERNIENNLDSRTGFNTLVSNWWLLSECFRLLGNIPKSSDLLKKAQSIIYEYANKISDSNQRKYFIEEHHFHQKILTAI